MNVKEEDCESVSFICSLQGVDCEHQQQTALQYRLRGGGPSPINCGGTALSSKHSQMPRHLISDAHEWINEIPTVPIKKGVIYSSADYTYK